MRGTAGPSQMIGDGCDGLSGQGGKISQLEGGAVWIEGIVFETHSCVWKKLRLRVVSAPWQNQASSPLAGQTLLYC